MWSHCPQSIPQLRGRPDPMGKGYWEWAGSCKGPQTLIQSGEVCESQHLSPGSPSIQDKVLIRADLWKDWHCLCNHIL